MLGALADIASILSLLISAVTLFLVAQMSSVAKGTSNQASNQALRAKDISNSDVRQSANERRDEKH